MIVCLTALVLLPYCRAGMKFGTTGKNDVIAMMKQVVDWQLDHPRYRDTDWQNGPFYAGIMEFYRVAKDQRYLDIVVKMGEKNDWNPGNRLRLADDQCIGQTYIEVYLMKHDPRMLGPIQDAFDGMMAAPQKGREEWYWCDALFMAPPVLARLATATGRQAYLDFMNAMWWDATDYLYDPQEQLYFRDERFFSMKEANGQKVFWSRGNGWVLAGLCRVLDYMPRDYPHRERYLALFRQMAAKIGSLQQDDGFWRTSLLDPRSYPAGESSGTAFFTYAMAWGINHGLLPRATYMPIVARGWGALCGAIDDEGKLGWVQQVGDRPNQVQKKNAEPYGTGAFLLAGSEMARLLETEHFHSGGLR